MKNILIVDFNNLIIRCHFTFSLSTSDGKNSGMFYGVLKMLDNKIRRYKIDKCIIAFDKKPYWRKLIFPEYKHGRTGMANLIGEGFIEDFYEQLDDLKNILPNLGFYCFSYDGWEADDIAAAFSWKFSKNNNIYLYSGDHDWIQLVRPNVTVVKAKTKIQDEEYTLDNFEDMVGVSPEDYVEVLSIAGDGGDYIPSIFANRIEDETGVYWKNPPRIISENKVLRILKNPYNTVENLLNKKINPVKGIGKQTEDLFLNITKKELDAYNRNKKLVNLRDGEEKYNSIISNKNEFENIQIKYSKKIVKNYFDKWECKNLYLKAEDDTWPYYYSIEHNKRTETVDIDKNNFLNLLKGKQND